MALIPRAHTAREHRPLLVEQHADQQRERVGIQQCVGGRILDKPQFRHPDSRGDISIEVGVIDSPFR